MKIELCEDNGVLNGGNVTLVVLQVTQDNGKIVRIPYEANKTIQDLYSDIARMPLDILPSVKPIPAGPIPRKKDPSSIVSEILGQDQPVDPNAIEREDLVKCVQVIKREFGIDLNTTPQMGRIYRVIDIMKVDGNVLGYDVLDDQANNKIRIPAFANEVVLHQKHVKQAPRLTVFSVTKTCHNCQELNALNLNDEGTMYTGKCSKCQVVLSEPRPQQPVDLPGAVPDLPLELTEVSNG